MNESFAKVSINKKGVVELDGTKDSNGELDGNNMTSAFAVGYALMSQEIGWSRDMAIEVFHTAWKQALDMGFED